MRKNGRRRPEVANRLHIFHTAALNRLETDGHTNQSNDFAVRSITSKRERLLKRALLPGKATWFATLRRILKKLRLKCLPIPRKLLHHALHPQCKQLGPEQSPAQPSRERDRQHHNSDQISKQR